MISYFIYRVCKLTEEKSMLEKMLSSHTKKDSTCKKVSDLKILQFKKEIEILKNENLLLQSEIDDISQEKKKNNLLASEYSRNKDELEKYKVIAADQERELKKIKTQMQEENKKRIEEKLKLSSLMQVTKGNMINMVNILNENLSKFN
jgi:hypothetical protein